MKTLQLSELEMTRLKAFYEEELDKTLRKLDHIKQVLKELAPGQTSIEINVTSPQSLTSPVKTPSSASKPVQMGRRKKTGPKSIWGNYILKRLRQLDKPVTYSDLIDDAVAFFKIPQSKTEQVRQSIRNSAFRLRNKHNKIDTFAIKGKKEKYVGLKKWFDKEGKILSDYKQKL